MKHQSLFVGFLLATTLFIPMLAGAHERQLITIGGTDYLFVVGSLGEPVVVDDKTGVELRVKIADPKAPTDSAAVGSKPVEGLDATLKVEIAAGDKKKTFDFSAAYKDPGAYKAMFFPTVHTALSYRIFGVINNTPVDLSFVCAEEGTKAVEDKSEVKLGDGVVRKYKNGQFGCPLAKEALGFPEEGMTVSGLHEDLHGEMKTMEKDIDNKIAQNQGGAGLAFGLLGTMLGVIALMKSRKPKV